MSIFFKNFLFLMCPLEVLFIPATYIKDNKLNDKEIEQINFLTIKQEEYSGFMKYW